MKIFTRFVAIIVMVLLGISTLDASEMATSKAPMMTDKQQKKGRKMPSNFRAVKLSKAQILQDSKSKIYCKKCGMTLPMFYRTNHSAVVRGKVEQYCSIYCLVEAMRTCSTISDIKVVDNTSLKFIDATKAFYVVGSSKPATMAAKISKYAFGLQADAQAFAKSFGGEVMSYANTLALAKADYAKDTKQKLKRQAKGAKKGEMIYKKMCQPITQRFTTAADAKAYIKAHNSCANLRGKALQAVGLYLKDLR